MAITTISSTIVKPPVWPIGRAGADEIPERSRRGEATFILRFVLRSFSEVESLSSFAVLLRRTDGEVGW